MLLFKKFKIFKRQDLVTCPQVISSILLIYIVPQPPTFDLNFACGNTGYLTGFAYMHCNILHVKTTTLISHGLEPHKPLYKVNLIDYFIL